MATVVADIAGEGPVTDGLPLAPGRSTLIADFSASTSNPCSLNEPNIFTHRLCIGLQVFAVSQLDASKFLQVFQLAESETVLKGFFAFEKS